MDSPVSAVEIARRGLCRMIATGELATGQLLPSEAELCERFEVSRSSLREAQKMLAVAGVLTARPGSRTAVSDMSAQQMMSGLEMIIPLLPLDRFLELFPLREVLEGHAAALSAAKVSDGQCRRLAELADELAATEPSDRAQLLDADFHSMIIDGAGDEVIAALLATIRRRGRDYHVYEDAGHADLKVISDQAHHKIAQAIAGRDPESARFLAMQHVRTTREWLEGIRPGPVIFEAGTPPLPAAVSPTPAAGTGRLRR
ncbi:MAG: FCD domain-containing protein [Propionicimonas sp.]|uniref:FadR/GntR family transcriptional regulator n=1 Tax=Propionicimonas sp. TaxID=1955623 RepID=UPI002B21ACC6|nr:FCD domain-containing protein [Propionicimonas sp.]MEA4945199.1 FCD domain-containing protein [Propionicimonas sp.]MEA5052851.1 FCD domain-containing protein [Propionicimonas sp.]